MMPKFDRGQAILLEFEYKKRTPHVSSPAYFNPSSVRVSVFDPTSTVVVSTAVVSLSNANSAGLWHYILQSSTSWTVGHYTAKVTAMDGTVNDITVEDRVFEVE